jgi:hypothetical protein
LLFFVENKKKTNHEDTHTEKDDLFIHTIQSCFQ